MVYFLKNYNNDKATISSKLNTLSTSFQTGVSTIVNAVNSKAGTSLANNSAPSLIANTIAGINTGIPDPLFTLEFIDWSISGLRSYGLKVLVSNSDVTSSSEKIPIIGNVDIYAFGLKFTWPYSGGGQLYYKKVEIVNSSIKVKYSGDMNTVHTSSSNPTVVYFNNSTVNIDETTGAAMYGSKIYVYRNL